MTSTTQRQGYVTARRISKRNGKGGTVLRVKWLGCALGPVASRICKSLDFTGYLSNLSVLPKAETRLFYADLCERPPIQTTGHRSTGVRAYVTRESDKSGGNLDRAEESVTDNVVINWKSVFIIMGSVSPSSCRCEAVE